MVENIKRKYPIKVSMPPGLMKSPHSGKTYIVAGCMIEVPDETTFADMHKYVTYERPKIPNSTDTWKVKSSSGSTYTVVKLDNGEYTCTCIGFKYHRKCKHIRQVKNQFRKDCD